MNKVVLLIGGNKGNRQTLIEQATALIRERIGAVVAASRVYETAPWGEFAEESGVESFLNRALLVETGLQPLEVLHEALAIEKDLGRQRDPKDLKDLKDSRLYRSRPMDIDLIFYDDLVMDTPELTLPHPRMHKRQFVLEPLAEIMPDYRHPLLGKTVKELLEQEIARGNGHTPPSAASGCHPL